MTTSRLDWSGYLLGFALGGFFDGILLHQILQWHHLLSLVRGVETIAQQVLFDGLFHALMYVIAAAGLIMLSRARGSLSALGAGRKLFASALVGFGVWHILDSLLSHWVLGIHRINLASDDPLFWDLLWFFAFGVLPLVIGWLMRRGPGARQPSGRSVALGLVLALLVAGPWTAMPPADAKSAVVMFGPGVSQGDAFNAIIAAEGQPLWYSRGVWAVSLTDEVRSGPLYNGGAMIVSSSLVGAGCLAWSEI